MENPAGWPGLDVLGMVDSDDTRGASMPMTLDDLDKIYSTEPESEKIRLARRKLLAGTIRSALKRVPDVPIRIQRVLALLEEESLSESATESRHQPAGN
jgi:hypothetical protein